ncbi:hypothetical protein MMC30_000074 [Trapelia coarctata]|nr:hypothetical protein [Trapelia coarctata]
MLLRKEDNPPAFDALVQGFLTAYGSVYWGSWSRDHLVVSDPSKGFLHPRDSRRENSRLVTVLEDLFNYKARTARVNDSHKPDTGKLSILPTLNLAALDPEKVNQLEKALKQAETKKLEKASLGIEAAFREIDKMRESMEVQSYASSEGDPEFYDEFGQERQPTKTRNVSHHRLTRPNVSMDNERHASEAASDLPLTGPTAALETGRRNKRRITYTEVKNEPIHSGRSKAQRRRGLFASGAVETRNSRASRRISQPSPTLTNPDHDSPDYAPHNAPRAASRTAPRDAAHETTQSPPAEPKTPKTEMLSNDISGNVFLLVIASNQQHLGPVTVNLNDYTSAHEGFDGFFDFLAKECELGDRSENVTAVSATYLWSGRKHRFRKDKVGMDGKMFFDHITRGFGDHSEFAKTGCEVEMLLHVDL